MAYKHRDNRDKKKFACTKGIKVYIILAIDAEIISIATINKANNDNEKHKIIGRIYLIAAQSCLLTDHIIKKALLFI